MDDGAGTENSSSLSFSNIRGIGGKPDVGQFKISGDLFGWRNKKTQGIHQYNRNQVDNLDWIKTSSKECQLKIVLKTGELLRFDGFREQDFEALSKYTDTHWKASLHKVKQASRGWHWGEYKWSGNNFSFVVDGKHAFDIHAPDISQVTTPSKTDLAVEFKEEIRDPEEDQLLEIRFYVPPPKDGVEDDPTDKLKEDLVARSGVGSIGADSVCQLGEIAFLVPRGRYEIDMMKASMKLHGKSYDFPVMYKTINKMFLLPRPNSPHVVFVVSLDSALRQGMTRYQNLVLQFDNNKIVKLNLNMTNSELEELKVRNTGIDKELEGNQYEVVSRVFKALINKPIIVPGDFKSTHQNSCIRCSHKASDGHLYPLNKFFYIYYEARHNPQV